MKTFTQFLKEDIQTDLVKIAREEIQQLFGGVTVAIKDGEGCTVVFVQQPDSDGLCNALCALGYAEEPAGDSGMEHTFTKGAVSVGAERNYRKGGGTTTDGFNLYIYADADEIAAQGYPT